MKNNTPASRIGASVLVTLALIVLSYLLLPKVPSVGAATGTTQILPRTNAQAAATREANKRARTALGGLPLSFEMNRGQFDGQVKFASRGAGYKAFLTQSETVFILKKPGTAVTAMDKIENVKGANHAERMAEIQRLREARAAERAASKSVVRMSFAGANPAPQVTGIDELTGKINYFRGNNPQGWINDVPTFRRVAYTGLYPGIDLVYYAKGRTLEYDLRVAPGADPNQIALYFDGAEKLEVDAATGALVVHAAGGAEMRQGQPVIYQELNGTKQAVAGAFNVNGNRAGFTVGNYDRSRPLVIDPAIISYSTYLAGEDNDRVHDIAADAAHNAYAVGWTESETFPVKDAYQAGQNNNSDEAFITKFNPDGSELIWSTYLGGGQAQIFQGEGIGFVNPSDGAYGVALDADHNVYVTGFAFSADFPVRNAMQTHLSDACCGMDSFITKLNAAGNQLVFSTYFGGADGNDSGRGIAVDRNNNIYVVGYTDSFAFPTTKPIQREIDGRVAHFHNNGEFFDGYVAKIDPTGQTRIYSTYLGGPRNDVALGVAVDRDGNAYVTGWTESTEMDPGATPTPTPSVTPTPTPTPNGGPSATPRLLFPTTDTAFQKNPGGNGFTRDAFVTKVNAAGTEYIYSTFLGGAGQDTGWGIALGPDRSAYVTGYTNSGSQRLAGGPSGAPVQGNFPTTPNAFQPQNNGGYDAFLTRLAPDGSTLIYSTYIGGAGNEGDGGGKCLECGDRYDGGAVAVDLLGNAYITGWTESTFVSQPASPTGPAVAPLNFPTKDAFQPNPGASPGSSPPDSRDAFVSMFNTNVDNAHASDSLVYSSFLGGSRRDEGQAITLDPGGNPFIGGWTQSDSSCGCGCQCDASANGPAAVGDNDFPTTLGAFQKDPVTDDDGFVVKLVGGTSSVQQQTQGFMIYGQVLNEDGDPVPGVTMTLDKPDGTMSTTTTDANGVYSFPNLAPNPETPYTVTPSGAPYVYTPPSRNVILVNQNERADFLATVAEPSPTPTPTPTATPTPTIAAQALNLSTRLHVLIGDQVGICGFIISGNVPKHVIVRAIGPSLTRFGIPNPLSDPFLELHGTGSFVTVTNNNWRSTQEAQIKASGIPPTDDLEAAIDITLAPGSYTGIIKGNAGQTGIGLIEVYDLDQAGSAKLANISTRGFVGSTPGDSVIAGFILGGGASPDRIVIRGLGPSLTAKGVPNVLQNPTLELHNGDGALLFTNNDWQDNPTNAAEVAAAGLAPTNTLEAAIAVTLPPGVYSAILAGLQNTTGNGLIEIYDRGGP